MAYVSGIVDRSGKDVTLPQQFRNSTIATTGRWFYLHYSFVRWLFSSFFSLASSPFRPRLFILQFISSATSTTSLRASNAAAYMCRFTKSVRCGIRLFFHFSFALVCTCLCKAYLNFVVFFLRSPSTDWLCKPTKKNIYNELSARQGLEWNAFFLSRYPHLVYCEYPSIAHILYKSYTRRQLYCRANSNRRGKRICCDRQKAEK